MSLYGLQKFLYELNRNPAVQAAYRADAGAALAGYPLDADERRALAEPDFGLLYVLGVNGQILMHFGAFHGVEWRAYLQLLQDGLDRYGPVRAGVYAITGYEGVDAHTERLKAGGAS